MTPVRHLCKENANYIIKIIIKWLMLGILVQSASVFAYEVKIRFLDTSSQPVSNLTVTAGGKTASFDGNYYVISDLAEGSYALAMSTDGYKPFSVNFNVGSNHPRDDQGYRYAIKTVNGYQVTGRTTDENGASLAGVTVSFEKGSTTTDTSGNYVINFSEPSSYTLKFEKSGYLAVNRGFGVNDNSPRATISTQIVTGYTVIGTVQDINRQGLAGVSVQVAGRSATTDGSGNYTVSGITTTGNQVVKLSKNGKTLEHSIILTETQPLYKMYTLYMVDGYIIYGLVYDVYNKPVSGITVMDGSVSAITDATGKYQMVVSAPGAHIPTIKHNGYKEVSVVAAVSDTAPSIQAPTMFAINTDGYYVYGNIKLADTAIQPSDITVKAIDSTGAIVATAHPDNIGNFVLKGVYNSGAYDIAVSVAKEGYGSVIKTINVNDRVVQAGLGTFDFTPKVSMKLIQPKVRRDLGNEMVSGGSKTFYLEIENFGAGPVNNVRLFADPALPSGFQYQQLEVIDSPIPKLNSTMCNGPYPAVNVTSGSFTTVPPFIFPSQCGGARLDCGSLIMLGGRSVKENSSQQPCNTTADGLTCTMQVAVTVASCGGGSGTLPPWTLNFKATGIGCEDYGLCNVNSVIDGVKLSQPLTTITKVLPKFYLDKTEGKNQLKLGETTSYTLTTINDAIATTAVTNATIKIALPELVELESAEVIPVESTSNARRAARDSYRSQQCSISSDKIITCYLDTLPPNTGISVHLNLKSVRVGQGKLTLILSSDQTIPLEENSNTFSVIPLPPPPPPMPVGDADLMFIIDDTGSMVEELTALGDAISEYMTLFGQTGPNVGLVTFKDNVTNRILGSSGGLAATNNMNWLLNGYSNFITGIKQLGADGGADCPEASLKALDTAKDLVKVGGRMIVITDASSHPDVDVDTLITALRAKGVRVDVILSGEECTGLCGVDTGEANKDSISAINTFSRIASETGGLFVTPFEVNDNSTTGKTYYQKVAVNLLKSSVSPTVTTVTPNAIPQGTTTDVVLNAANVAFNADSEVSFGSDITVNAVEMVSPTKLKANISVASNASVKFYDVTVATTNGEVTDSATGIGVVEVVASSTQPTILSVTPDSIMRGGNAEITVNMANTQLAAGTTLSFESGSGIVVKSIKINSVTSLTATLDVSNAQLGTHKMSIKTNGVEISTDCSMKASPKDGAVLITPNLTEGTVPYLTQVTPNRGTQGAVREITIDAINTHFVQDVTELRFGTEDIYVLKLNITSATQAVALIQIDSEAVLGLTDIYMYTDDEFASILEGFEVVAKGPYSVEGCILDAVGAPIADVQLDTGEQLAFSDNSCFFRIEGLNEGEYTLNLDKTGYKFDSVDLIVSNNTAINGVVRLPTQTPTSSLVVDSRSDNWNIYQGDTVTHTITASNYGEVTATGVVLRYQLPSDMTLVSAEALGGGQCQPLDNLLTCTLSDIGINQQAMVKLTLHSEGSGTLMNEFELLTNEYPVSTKKSWTTVNPYLFVSITDSPDPVLPTSSLYYSVVVELSAYAAEMSKTKATGVTLVDYLPSNVTFQEVVTDENTTCDTSKLPAITCQISDLSIENPGDISRVTVGIRVTLDDPGLLLVVNEARVSSNEFSTHKARERTVVNIGEGTVDAAIVLDITGSMQEEINGSVRAISQLIDKLGNNAAPVIGLVVFKDSVTVQAVTSDLALLKKTLSGLVAEGGGTCPEASVEAIDRIIPHLKQGGAVIFASDAAPYEDADIDGLAAKLKAKQIKLTSLLSGNCSNIDAWNDIATELSQ